MLPPLFLSVVFPTFIFLFLLLFWYLVVSRLFLIYFLRCFLQQLRISIYLFLVLLSRSFRWTIIWYFCNWPYQFFLLLLLLLFFFLSNFLYILGLCCYSLCFSIIFCIHSLSGYPLICLYWTCGKFFFFDSIWCVVLWIFLP